MKIVLTGSSSGIGRSLAENLLSQGHQVWGVARSDQAKFAAEAPGFRFSRCDVADWEQVEAAAREIATEWKGIDAIVTCAGIHGAVGPAMEVSAAGWARTVRSNLEGTFFIIRALFQQLTPTGQRAKIVCFSGGGATKPRVNFSAYGVAKTGIVRLVETLAEEWRENAQAIDINAVAPGAINTGLTEEILQLGPSVVGAAEYEQAVKLRKTDGASSIERALGLVTFLLSAESDGISGRLLSAPWDPWPTLAAHRDVLARSDIYTLRRIIPEERNVVLG